MAATRRSGSRSRLKVTPFTSGVFTLFRYRRLNLSPSHRASAMGAGMGMSPVACMVARPIFCGPFISTLPFRRKEARVSLTEPEARIMKHGNDGGMAPSYNVQISVDAEEKIIVGIELTQSSSDSGSLQPAMEQVKEAM